VTATEIELGNPAVAHADARAHAYSTARFALWLLAGYLGLTLLPLLRGASAASPSLLLAHGLGLVLTCQAARLLGRGSTLSPLLAWLPLLAIPLLYTELPTLMLGAGSTYHDAGVQQLELALFGGDSPARSLAAMTSASLGVRASLAVSELLHMGYLSFYAIIYGPMVILSLRNEPPVFSRAVIGLTAVFLAGFVAFIVAPVQGPRYLWPAPLGVPDGFFRALSLRVLESGSSRGTAFPSLHVAIAVTQSLFALHWLRPLGITMAVLTVLLATGAVYGGYHYAVDVIAGAMLGSVAGALLRRSTRRAELSR